MDTILKKLEEALNKPYKRYENIDQILNELKLLVPSYFNEISMNDEYKYKIKDIDKLLHKLPAEYICDTSFEFRDLRKVNNNVLLSKNRNNFKIEDYLDYVVYYARKKLINGRDLRKNFSKYDLSDRCLDSSEFVKEGSELCDLECYIIRIDPGFDEDANLLNNGGFHYFNIIKHQNRYYLVDVSYSQFFIARYCNFSRMGIPLIFPPTAGAYMVLDKFRLNIATIINKFGWIELNDDILKAYLDGFALSYRNALYYENKDLIYETPYSAKDYKNFLINEDSQVRHEGTRVLGYQSEPIKNPYRSFKQ